MNKIAIPIILFAVSCAAISSCGIPTTHFLGPPNQDTVSWSVFAPPSVTFAHNVTDNSGENFVGYEIYYKFYQHTANPSDGDFGDDYATLAAAAPGSGITTLQDSAFGFRRIWKAGDTVVNLPLISINSTEPPTDPATPFDVESVFPDRISALSPDPAQAIFLDRTGENSIKLVRDPEAAPGPSGKTFESEDISTDPADPDIPAGIPPTDDRIHMAIVILAYGLDYAGGTFQPLYSDPLIVEQLLEIILH